MRNQSNVLQFIPVISTTDVNPSLSVWQRVRVAASSVIAKVRAVSARIAAFVSKKVSGARASIARVARVAMVRRPWILSRDGASHAVSHSFQWCSDTWRRVVCPFMRVRVVVLGIGAVVVGLAVSPVTTLVILAGCGAALVGLSRLVSVLETSERPAARFMLVVIEWVTRTGRVLVYVAASAVVIGLCFMSMAFAATEVLELVLRYLDVVNAASMAALAFFVMTASWGLAIVEVAWLILVHTDKRRVRTPSQERQVIPLIRIDAERAWNGDSTPIVVGADEYATGSESHSRTSPCMGCDLDDGGARFGVGNLSTLCGQCFSYLVEDELITAADAGQVSAEDVTCALGAGIEVPASVIIASGARLRSTRVALNAEAITCRSVACSDSERDPTKIYWAETAWWFDGRGNRRARRWHGFVAGLVAGQVDYVYDREIRGFYVATPRREGSPQLGMGPYRTLSYAQEIAADELSDKRLYTGTANTPKTEATLDSSLRSVS